MVLLIIVAFIGVAIFQIPRLKQAGHIREVVFFSIFWLAGFVLLLLLNAGVKFPSVIGAFMDIFDSIGLHY